MLKFKLRLPFKIIGTVRIKNNKSENNSQFSTLNFKLFTIVGFALDRLRFGKARNKNFVFFLHLHSACTIFASILWVAKRCPPHGRHICESVFSFILFTKIANFHQPKDKWSKTPMRAYFHPIGGV